MRVLAGTSKIHAETFARALGAEVVDTIEPKDDWVFLVGVDPAHCKTQVQEARSKGQKIAAFWIGSDSLAALQDANFRKNVPTFDVHFAVHERIQAELASWKVPAQVVYPCARNYFTANEVPKRDPNVKRVVGIYSPTPGPEDLYMHNDCVQIAKENPDIQFVFYGAEKYQDLPDNCLDSGRMTPEDTKDIYSKFSCILRLCHHDGFPVGGIEAKIRNLNVIENFAYPGFLFAETLEDVNRVLQDPKTHEEDKGPWPAWYRENCSPEAFGRRVKDLLQI